MKISIITIILLSLTIVTFSNDMIYSSKVIIENANQLESMEIQYKGEAIGDIMYRDNQEYGWVNVSDSENAIGIWASKQELEKIKTLGKYEVIGDTILVTGKVHSACVDHGGDLDIHATNIEVIENGYQNKQQFNESIYTILRILTIPTVLLLLLVFFINRNKEKSGK